MSPAGFGAAAAPQLPQFGVHHDHPHPHSQRVRTHLHERMDRSIAKPFDVVILERLEYLRFFVVELYSLATEGMSLIRRTRRSCLNRRS